MIAVEKVHPRLMLISEAYGKQFFGVAQVLRRLTAYCMNTCIPYKMIVAIVGDVSDKDRKRIDVVPAYPASRLFRWHPAQKKFFDQQISDFNPDVIHIHGVFTFIQKAAVNVARERGIPVIISPHGMLEPWLWKQKGMMNYWLKSVYWKMILMPSLQKVDFVHAITDQESETLEQLFPNVPQVNISNAIDLSEFNGEQQTPDAQRYLLFVGRLHPKKGVDMLIKAFKQTGIKDAPLIIAGPDFDASYTLKLKLLVEKLGLKERVFFIGAVLGEKKSKLLTKAWCTVIPSYSDVVALVNLESAASFTPTITTTMTGLSDWEESGGLLVEPELVALAEAITTACHWSLEERMQKGQQARNFMEQKYSWDVIGEQWVEAYKVIAESGKNKHGK